MNEDYDSRENVLAGLKDALCEVRLMRRGEIPEPTQTWEEFKAELEKEIADEDLAVSL